MESNSKCWYKDSCKELNCSSCVVYPQMRYQFEESGLPEAKWAPIKLSPESIDYEAFKQLAGIRKNIVDFVEQGQSLFIYSNVTGNGKTSWAIKLLQTYFHYVAVGNYGIPKACFVSTAGLLLKLKDFKDNEVPAYLDLLKKVDLVVWDDVAVTALTPFDYNQLYTILEARSLAEKANIFTSNCTPEELDDLVGARNASRMLQGTVIEFKGGDRRG